MLVTLTAAGCAVFLAFCAGFVLGLLLNAPEGSEE